MGNLRELADALDVVAGADTIGMTFVAGVPAEAAAAGAPTPYQLGSQQICN